MASRIMSLSAYRILLIGALVIVGMLAVVPRVASQDPRTLDVDVVFAEESFEVIPALGNPLPEFGSNRGDLLSGQGAVYASGDRTTRIGTFYFMAVGTADSEHFETAANHIYAFGHLEIWGEGTLAITGTPSFLQPVWVAITGGTGAFAMAHGQCLEEPFEEYDRFTCEIQ